MEIAYKKKQGELWRKYGLFAGLSALTLAGFFFVFGSGAPSSAPLHSPEEEMPSVFGVVDIEAKAAYAFEINTGRVLYAKNADVPLPLASVAKLMTALVALDTLPPNTPLEISEAAIVTTGESGLSAGEKWMPGELAAYTLLVSSNDGAAALAENAGAHALAASSAGAFGSGAVSAFVEKMNAKAEALGLSQTSFKNPTGLDERGEPSTWGSAEDAAHLLVHVLKTHPALAEATRYKTLPFMREEGILVASSTNLIVGAIPGLIASKTGSTPSAGGNLVVVFDRGIGDPVAIAVLGGGEAGRFIDVQILVEAALLDRTYDY